jgi:TPR repeat protein
MKRLRWIVLVMLAALIGCEDQASPPHTSGGEDVPEQFLPPDGVAAVSTGQEDLVLKDDELRELQIEALDGKANAAARIAMHFAELSISNPPRRTDSVYWFAISAENGDLEGMLMQSKLIYESGGWRNCRRARYWLGRAQQIAPNDEVRDSIQHWQGKISSDKVKCAVHPG